MKEQLKTVHFWLVIVTILLGGALIAGLIPSSGRVFQVVQLAMIVLNALGVQQAARWVPPNAPTLDAAARARRDAGRASIGLVVMLALAGAGAAGLGGGCSAGGRAALKQTGFDIARCALGEVPGAITDLVKQAEQSLEDAPGAPPWRSFASDALLARGIDAAICAIQAALHNLDSAPSHAQPTPQLELAHRRANAWLVAYDVAAPSPPQP